MPLTERVDWFRMVTASCRRVERLFLDQGVAGRERLRRAPYVCVFVRNTAVLKEVPSSRAQTHTCTYAAVPLKSQCGVYSMCLLPFFSPP